MQLLFKARFLALLFISATFFSGGAIQATDMSEELIGYSELIRAEAEYIRMVGEARLAWAKARLTDAQADMQFEEVRKLRLFVNRLELELKRLRRDEHKAREKIEVIERLSGKLGPLANGKTDAFVFRALKTLFAQVIPPEVLVSTMSHAADAYPESQFIANRKTDPLKAFAGGNVGQLLRFLEVNNFSLEPWSAAHLNLLSGLAKLGTAATEKVAKTREYMEGIRKGTFSIWSPPGMKPEAKPAKPGETQVLTTPATGLLSHRACLPAKAGFKACVEDGQSREDCVLSDKGFAECRNDGYAARECIKAKSGYKLCRDDGRPFRDCVAADSGFAACRAAGGRVEVCVKAKSGFKACQDEGNSLADCLLADKGYADCRADGQSSRQCLAARGTFKFCRADGFDARQCATVGKGYQQCRENGYPPSSCEKADEGYKDCMTGL